MLATLFRLRFRIWWSELRRSRSKGWGAVFFMAAGLIVAYALAESILAGVERAKPGLIDDVMPALFVGLIVFPVLRAMALVIHELFLDSDIELLLAAPVTWETLFAFKLLDLLRMVMGSGAFLIGVVAAHVHATGRSVWVVVLAAPVVVLLLGFVVALSMLVVLLVTRTVSPRRMSGTLALLSTFAGASVVLLGQLAGGRPSNPGVVSFFENASTLGARTWWAPTTWAGNLLAAVGQDDWPRVALEGARLVAVTSFGVAVCAMVFSRTFVENWGRVREVGLRGRRAEGAALRFPAILRAAPPWVRAVALKDWRASPRDSSLAGMLVLPVVFTVLAVVRSAQASGGPLWTALTIVLVPSFVVAAQLGTALVTREGRNIELFRLAPISMTRLLAGKALALGGPLPLFLLPLCAVVLARRDATMTESLVFTFTALWAALGFVSIDVGYAGWRGLFSSDNPNKTLDLLDAALLQLVKVVFGALVTAPLTLASKDLGAAVGIAPLLAAGIPVVLIRAGGRRLERLESSRA